MRPKIIPFPSAEALRCFHDTASAARCADPATTPTQSRFFPELPMRLESILLRLGFSSPSQVAAAIRGGDLVFGERHVFHRSSAGATYCYVRNCGFASYAVIAAWAGVTPNVKSTITQRSTPNATPWDDPGGSPAR